MGLWAAIKYLLDRTIGGYEVFNTPGLHTFVPPKGIFDFYITACGAGGGGGASGANWGGSGGGGGAAIKNKKVKITEPISITIGKGGNTNHDSNFNGTAGGATIIQNVVTLAGGGAGRCSNGGSVTGGAAGGVGGGKGGNSTSIKNGQGKEGEPGLCGKGGLSLKIDQYASAGGGGGSLGNGGNGGSESVLNTTKPGFGGGAGGEATVNGLKIPGGNGIVIIMWGINGVILGNEQY